MKAIMAYQAINVVSKFKFSRIQNLDACRLLLPSFGFDAFFARQNFKKTLYFTFSQNHDTTSARNKSETQTIVNCRFLIQKNQFSCKLLISRRVWLLIIACDELFSNTGKLDLIQSIGFTSFLFACCLEFVLLITVNVLVFSVFKISCLTCRVSLNTSRLAFSFTSTLCGFIKPAQQPLQEANPGGPLDNQTWIQTLAATKAWFSYSYTTALWPVEQPSILSAKLDCPVARQKFVKLAHFPIALTEKH